MKIEPNKYGVCDTYFDQLMKIIYVDIVLWVNKCFTALLVEQGIRRHNTL